MGEQKENAHSGFEPSGKENSEQTLKANEETFLTGRAPNFVNNMIYITETLYCPAMGLHSRTGFPKTLSRILPYVNLFASDTGKMFLLTYHNFGFVFLLVVHPRLETV